MLMLMSFCLLMMVMCSFFCCVVLNSMCFMNDFRWFCCWCFVVVRCEGGNDDRLYFVVLL